TGQARRRGVGRADRRARLPAQSCCPAHGVADGPQPASRRRRGIGPHLRPPHLGLSKEVCDLMSKVKDVVRARIKARIAAMNRPAEPGLGSVTLAPVKTKAEIQDELDAAGVEYPKNARKADLEALLPGNTTPDLGAVVAEDVEQEKPN